MYKKIIVLFLLLGTSIFVLPAESKAAEKSGTTITTNTLAASSAITPQRYRRRWRNNRRNYRRSSWNYGRYRRNYRGNYRRSYRRVYYTPYYRRNYRRYRNY
jgi:hypothetical protein